jgi:hypothetical protein
MQLPLRLYLAGRARALPERAKHRALFLSPRRLGSLTATSRGLRLFLETRRALRTLAHIAEQQQQHRPSAERPRERAPRGAEEKKEPRGEEEEGKEES